MSYSLFSCSRVVLSYLFFVCLGILGAAYVMENSFDIHPCQMCRYEQYVFASAGVLSLLGMLLSPPLWRGRILSLLALVFLGGTVLAAYHVAIQQHWVSLPAFCASQDFSSESINALKEQMMGTPFVRCDQITWSLFGLSLAAYNALISFGLMLLCWVSSACKKK